ncbi:MAG: dehydrogenase [Pseudomonadota bacterium]|nr:SDR family oxidoreductase [Rubrivivax sp.]NLZ42214.1 SDR family oxidoreductase [Comamonadaceae bacterium]
MTSRRLDGHGAVVTGASTGIGAAIVRHFVAEGARVVFCGRTEGPGRALADELGSAARFVIADVTRPEDTLRLVEQAAAWLGRIDSLVNNAAAPPPDLPVERIDAAALPGYMASVLGSTILMTSAAVPAMQRQGRGSIVNIGSTAAHRANSSSSVYSALKAAVCHFTRCTALELAPYGIRVNTVSPGAVPTAIFAKKLGIAERHHAAAVERLAGVFGEHIPLGRAGRPEDIAEAVLMFASGASAFVTGQDLVVDGGLTAGLSAAGKRAQVEAIRAALATFME